MNQRRLSISFFCATILTSIGCDMSPTTKPTLAPPVNTEISPAPQTKARSEKLLRIDLANPEATLTPIFKEVFNGARHLKDIQEPWIVVVCFGEPQMEVSVATEGLTLSRLDDGFLLSIHGIPATLADTTRVGKTFCRLFESPEEDQAAIDEWVADHHTRLDKTLSFIRDVGQQEVVLYLRSSFQEELPFRIYSEIYFKPQEADK